MHWKSHLLKVQQQIIATQADAGQSAAEALLSQNLNNTHVSTSAGASHEFISRKVVGDVVSFGGSLYVVSWGTYEGCDVAAIFNHTGSHRNDVNPVRNVTNKADEVRCRFGSGSTATSDFFHLLFMLWRRVTSIVLLFKVFTARIPK